MTPVAPVSAPALQVFCWNAGNGLNYDEWLHWCSQSGYDILQEIGWNFAINGTPPTGFVSIMLIAEPLNC